MPVPAPTCSVRGQPPPPDHGVQLVLDPLLDLVFPHHVDDGPHEGGGRGLGARQEQVKDDADQALHAQLAVEEGGSVALLLGLE